MSKYSDEFKLKIIKYCIEEFYEYGNTAKYFYIIKIVIFNIKVSYLKL